MGWGVGGWGWYQGKVAPVWPSGLVPFGPHLARGSHLWLQAAVCSWSEQIMRIAGGGGGGLACTHGPLLISHAPVLEARMGCDYGMTCCNTSVVSVVVVSGGPDEIEAVGYQ